MKEINRSTVLLHLAGLVLFIFRVVLALGACTLIPPHWRGPWPPSVIAIVALGFFFRTKNDTFSNLFLGAAITLGFVTFSYVWPS